MLERATMQGKIDDLVIVGLGPTGLAYALEACRNDSKKRNITLITDRESYTRDVIFRLDLDIFEYYRGLIGEETFQKALKEEAIGPVEDYDVSGFFGVNVAHRVIKIKTTETLLFENLAKQPQVKIITLAKHSSDHILEIHRNSNTLVYQKNNRRCLLHFSDLIEADGIHHEILDLIINHRLHYNPTQVEQLHSHHVRVNFKLPAGYTANQFRDLLNSGTTIKPSMSELHQLGWEHQSMPEFRLFVVQDTLYAGGECPAHIKTSDQHLIEKWIRLVLCSYLSKNIITQLTIKESATFDIKLDETLSPTITLSPNHASPSTLFLTGEVLRKSHYHTGSGAAVGLLEAQAFGEFLKTPQAPKDLQQYNDRVKAIVNANRARVDKYLTHRAERELAAKTLASESKIEVSKTQAKPELYKNLVKAYPRKLFADYAKPKTMPQITKRLRK